MIEPYYQHAGTTIYHGDCRDILPHLEPVDLVLTDPPYSSGGMTRSDRNLKTSDKYVMTGTDLIRPEFSGDNRDQRSFLLWCELWMRDCLKLAKKGAVLASFIDWRQLPTLTESSGRVGLPATVGINGTRPTSKDGFGRRLNFWFLSAAAWVDRDGISSPGFSVRDHREKNISLKPVASFDIIRTNFQTILDPFMEAHNLVAAKQLGEAIGRDRRSILLYSGAAAPAGNFAATRCHEHHPGTNVALTVTPWACVACRTHRRRSAACWRCHIAKGPGPAPEEYG